MLSPKTVRNHIANVMAKLSLKDRAAAIVGRPRGRPRADRRSPQLRRDRVTGAVSGR